MRKNIGGNEALTVAKDQKMAGNLDIICRAKMPPEGSIVDLDTIRPDGIIQ